MTVTKAEITCCHKSSHKCANVTLRYKHAQRCSEDSWKDTFLRLRTFLKTACETSNEVSCACPCAVSRVSYLSESDRLLQRAVGLSSQPRLEGGRRREVTLLQRPGNNGLFFPGSLLHPHRWPPIGRRSHRHSSRQEAVTNTTDIFSQSRAPDSEVTHFQSHFLGMKSVFSSLWQKTVISHERKTPV